MVNSSIPGMNSIETECKGTNVIHLVNKSIDIKNPTEIVVLTIYTRKTYSVLDAVVLWDGWRIDITKYLTYERKLKVWWPTTFDGPKIRETSCQTRKLAGRKKSSLRGEKLVSHPCTTFQTRKTRFVPKTNQNGCKTKVRKARRVVGSLEN